MKTAKATVTSIILVFTIALLGAVPGPAVAVAAAAPQQVVDAIDATIAVCTKACIPGRPEVSERVQALLTRFKAETVFGVRKPGFPKVFRSGSWVIEIGDEWGRPCDFAGTDVPEVLFRAGEIGILKTEVYVKPNTKAQVNGVEYVYEDGAWRKAETGGEKAAAASPTSVPTDEGLPKVQIRQAGWVPETMLKNLHPKPDTGKKLLIVKIEIQNSGERPVSIESKEDVQITIPDPKPQSFSAKGICVGQEMQWIGLPKGVNLKTKEGWVSSVSLDAKEPNIGTHLFLGLGSYKLTIDTGGKFTLPILFDVPRDAKGMKLQLNGAKAIDVTPGEL